MKPFKRPCRSCGVSGTVQRARRLVDVDENQKPVYRSMPVCTYCQATGDDA